MNELMLRLFFSSPVLFMVGWSVFVALVDIAIILPIYFVASKIMDVLEKH